MLTVKQRHEMQQDIAIYNVLNSPRIAGYWRTRSAMAQNMRQVRRLTDAQLRRVHSTLPG